MAYIPENPEEMLSKCSDAWKSHLGKYGWDAYGSYISTLLHNRHCVGAVSRV